MEIKVDVKKVNVSGKKGLDALMPTTYNKIAEALSKEIKGKLKGIECDEHKKQTKGRILVIAGEKPRFQKSNFCCKSFENKISFGKLG